jgi:hypothetical protein
MGHYTFTDFLVSRWEVAQQVLTALPALVAWVALEDFLQRASALHCSTLFLPQLDFGAPLAGLLGADASLDCLGLSPLFVAAASGFAELGA